MPEVCKAQRVSSQKVRRECERLTLFNVNVKRMNFINVIEKNTRIFLTSSIRFLIIFSIKQINSMLAYGVICCSHQSDRLGYVSGTNQIAALGYVSLTIQSVVFVLWFERCSSFNALTREGGS